MTKTTEKTKASAVKKAAKGKQKAEKIFHPESRKAGQMQREALRKAKLSEKLVKRGKKQMNLADRYAFFLHALPPDKAALTLAEIHDLVQSLWLTRHEQALEEEQTARRKGRPKSTKEQQLEEMKLQDAEEYRTGLDLPDLTDVANVALFRKWDGIDATYLRILHFIRICGDFPEITHVARIGRDKSTGNLVKPHDEGDESMDVDVSGNSVHMAVGTGIVVG